MNPTLSYELVISSKVLQGEKANKGLEATAAPTPHQMNRLKGFFIGGSQVVLAQRPGKGGMDFNKLLGGKVFAVAADAVSPVLEKDGSERKKGEQKSENGLPLYSSSGFYLLSSKEYPALHIAECFTRLRSNGEQVLLINPAQLANVKKDTLMSDMDIDLALETIQDLLGDESNAVVGFDEALNRKRGRAIEQAMRDAEAEGEPYAGATFNTLVHSQKDGNPFVQYAWKASNGETGDGVVLREVATTSDERQVISYLTAEEAIATFKKSVDYLTIEKLVLNDVHVDFALVQGHAMRTSVSFRKKVENVQKAPPEKAQYGDGVYITAALSGWTKGIVSFMYSQHPNFPTLDYDAHHYVVAPRQAEVGMNKLGDKWSPPKALMYDFQDYLLA